MHGPGANAAGMIIVQAIMSFLYRLGPFALSSTFNSGGGCASGRRRSRMIRISSADAARKNFVFETIFWKKFDHQFFGSCTVAEENRWEK